MFTLIYNTYACNAEAKVSVIVGNHISPKGL